MTRMDVVRVASLLLFMLSAGSLLALRHIEGEPGWSPAVLLALTLRGIAGSAFALARGARR